MIELSHVSKSFGSSGRRPTRAVDDASLRVAPGEVVCITGAAGAGKSTLIALLTGFMPPSSGSVLLDGQRPRAFIEREGIAYAPQAIMLHRRWRVDDALRRLATLAGVPASRVRERVDAVVEQFGLGARRRARVGSLTACELRRLALAQAIVAPHRIALFDEPTNDVEPAWRERFANVVAQLRAPDRAILLTARDAAAIGRVADRVVVMEHGRLRGEVDARVRAPGATQGKRELV